MIDWHRLFGIALTDFFANSPFVVELEKDLSLKRQLLDVVIIRTTQGQFSGQLPDGFDNLNKHNLITYKSSQEPLDDWSLDELIGYYVNYRKQVSPSLRELLPTDEFTLYGISTRFPQGLATLVELKPLSEGVYQVIWGTHLIRLLVLRQMQESEANVLWNLFSADRDKVVYGAQRYREVAGNVSSILDNLFHNYQLEGLIMPYTMEDFKRDVFRRALDEASPEEIFARFSADEILNRFSADEILNRFSADEILNRFSADERLAGLSLAEIRTYLQKREQQQSRSSNENGT